MCYKNNGSNIKNACNPIFVTRKTDYTVYYLIPIY